uniref:Integrator complex subunit 7-like C-terminal domain-containing protein n=1 Tax=Oryza barthii TaxID=65489 RepID=A0A0D3EIM2_9ORYZ
MGRRGIQPQPKKRRLVFLCLVVQPRALLSSVGPTPPLEERGERGEGAKQPNSRGGGRRPPPRIRPTPSPLVAVSRSKSSARRRHAAAALLLRAAPPLGGERRGWCAGERIPPLGAVAPPSLHHCLVRRRRRLRAPGSLRWGEGREGGERGESGIPGTPKCGDTPKCGEWLVGVGAHHLHSITRSNRGPTVSRKKHKKKKKGYRRAAAAASAMAMQWSIDLDRALRSRHPTPLLRPPPWASEPRLFAHTILLRLLATHFTTAHNARILRALLLLLPLPHAAACVQEPRPPTTLPAPRPGHSRCGCSPTKALHIRSLILSTFSSSNARRHWSTRHCLWLAVFRLSVDFSYITLEALPRLIIASPTTQAQIIMAAIKIFPKLDCTVGKQIVLGTLEDNFKADMLLSLSRLASKSVLLFGDQVELLLLFLEHESSHCMKTVSLKCLCFMFHGSICHFPVLRTVFGTLLQLIDDDDFPLDCKRDAFTVLQKIVCGKAPIVHFVDTSELSKLVLAAESSLHSSSWEMQGTALKVIAGTLCCLQQTRSHQNMITQEGSSLTYNGCQGITSNFLSTHVENDEDKFVHKIVTSMIYVKQYAKTSCVLPLLLLLGLIKELARLDDSDCSKVSVANVESFQTYSAREVLGTSNDIKPETASVMASHMGADFDKLKFDPTEFSSKKEVFIVRNIILSTLKFANTCHNMLSKTPGASCNLYDRIKELIECVQQNASQYCSTYEFFHLIMCACISWYACKTRDGNQESGDPTEQPDIFFSPSIWLTQELCAIRITKMLFRKQSSLAGSSELHGSQAKITDICSKTFLATDHLLSNTSSSHELFFQRWFISLRASFLEILADFLGILTAHLTDQRDESHHDAIGDHSSVPREHNNSQLLALVNCSLRLSELAHSYDLLAVSHGDMDRQSFSSIARLAFMCSLLAFCIAFSVDFSKIVTRMNCSGILEKDSYRLCKFAVAYFLRLRGDTKGIATGEYSVSPLHGGMQFLSSILQRVMELPFVLPKYFFRVRPCFGAELHIYDSNPENRDGISVPSGLQLSLTLCLQWKCVLERSNIDISKLLEAILRFSCKLSILLLRCNRNKKQRV